MLTVLAGLILAGGIGYAVYLCYLAWKDKDGVRAEKGKFWQIAAAEGVISFFSTMGFSEFLLNTLLLRKMRWVDDRILPGTLVAACILPNALIAFMYLLNGDSVDALSLLLCIAAISMGSFMGARVATSLSGEWIRLVVGIAMLVSAAALVVKMVLSAGAVNGDADFTVIKLCIALPVIFCLGFINMFGVPMKPATTALFLLLGLNPMSALTLMICMGIAAPLTGGMRVIRSGNYSRKVVLAAIFFGMIGALIGTRFTVSLNATVLSVILIVMMLVAAVSMLRPAKTAEK